MSTTIRNGYRLAQGADPFAIIPIVREALDPIRDQLDATMFAELVITTIDDADLRGEDRHVRPLVDTFTEWRKAQKGLDHLDRERDPNSVGLSFGRDPATGRIHALLSSDQREYTEPFEALPGVEPYPYWNDTDRPDDVTRAEWGQRREAWDRVLPGIGVPADTMLTFRLRPEIDGGLFSAISLRGGEESLILRSVPTRRQRARRIARNAYTEHRIKAAPEPNDPFRIVFEAMRETNRWESAALAIEPRLAEPTVDLFADGAGEHQLTGLREELAARFAREDTEPVAGD
ncbi:hypothetical protein V6N00_13590 [Tersicoccus sp. MR15.9]|uniref:hypothetical protein n=1 Tax=Tersicoccus mangrovi TaxID=3121635 RepID=UPI002FE6365A